MESLNYFCKLTKEDIVVELVERKVKFYTHEMRNDLKLKLDEAIKGCHRVPALIIRKPLIPLQSLGLGKYEVLPCEPLHSVSGHIKNLYDELPSHLNKTEKNYFNEAVVASFAGKEAKRAADYRLSIIDCILCLHNKIEADIYNILLQMCEIQEILYRGELKRTTMSILRLYNISFLHAIKLNETAKSPKVLTTRKLFGQYYHALMVHAPDQYRLLSGASANTEEEERTFNFLKTISTLTSNHHPENVLANAFLRMQFKEEYTKDSGISKIESKISQHYQHLQTKFNTVIPFAIIRKYPWPYQAHLERIADYLAIPGFWKEVVNGIKFSDVDGIDATVKQKHH